MPSNKVPKGLTAEQRMNEWDSFCANFYKDLTDRPGTVLPTPWRLAIVVAAQNALTCEGCASVGGVCLRPGTAFDVLSSLNHRPVSLDGVGDASDEMKNTILTLVYTMLNHQTKADEKWYSDTIKALDEKTNFVPIGVQGEARRSLITSLFAEILGLTIVSHGIDLSYRAFGRNPPPLPRIADVKEFAMMPTMWNVAGTLKRGKALRVDKQGAGWAPFVEYSDLEKSSVKTKFAGDQLALLKERMVAPSPLCVLSMSPHELLMGDKFFDTFGYQQKDIMKPWAPLDPNHHCPGFSRYDKEVVAAAVAETYNILLGASKLSTDKDDEKEKMLVELGTAVATRPFDEQRFAAACTSIKQSLGEGQLMEAIGIAAGMDASTRCVDFSGKHPLPAAMISVVSFVLRFIKWVVSLFRW